MNWVLLIVVVKVSLLYVVVIANMARNIGLNIGRKLRLTKFYQDQDELPSFDTWPPWARVSALNDDKTNHARFQFFQFLWRNGVRPHICGEWTRLYDVQHGKRKFLNDAKIIKHVNQMIHQALNDKGRGIMSRGRVYDLLLRRPNSGVI